VLVLSRRNFASLWATYREFGHHRVIVVGVLVERVTRREIGGGREAQIERTLAYARGAADPPGVAEIATDNRSVADIAAHIFGLVEWP
jgi:hypothetical protein